MKTSFKNLLYCLNRHFLTTGILCTIVIFLPVISRGQIITLLEKKKYQNYRELIQEHPILNKAQVNLNKDIIQVNATNNYHREIRRSQLPSALNSFVFSNDGKFFVAYEETENGIDELFFFSSSGSLLAAQKLSIYPNVKYSHDGKYVIVFNTFGSEVLIFTQTGKLHFQCNYQEILQDKSKVLDNVLVSEDGRTVVINAGGNAYGFDVQSKAKLFQSEINGWILDGKFYSSKKLIAVKIKSPAQGKADFSFRVFSGTDGKLKDLIMGVKGVEYLENGIVVLSDDKIIQYDFK